MNRLIHKTPLQDNVVKGERKEILISFPNQSNVTGRNRMHVAVDDIISLRVSVILPAGSSSKWTSFSMRLTLFFHYRLTILI